MSAHDSYPASRLSRRRSLQLGAAAAGALGASRIGALRAQEASPSPAASPIAGGDFGTSSLEVSGAVEIEYWQYEYATKVDLVNQLIPEFQQANPDITIKHVNFPYDDFQQQVAAAVQAGEGPDVLNMYYGWVPAYVLQQFLVPLPEQFSVDAIEQDFYSIVQSVKVQGQYYAIPTAVRTLALFCNKDLLDAAGQQPPTNWEEMVSVAEATVQKNGEDFEVVGFTWDIGGQGHNYWRECLTRQNGGKPVSDDNRTLMWTDDPNVEAFTYLTDFLLTSKVTQGGFQTDGPTAFASGKAALHVDGSYRLGTLASDAPDLNFQVVPLPEHQAKASFASFWCNGITRNAAEGDKAIAAAKWIDFLSSAEVQQRWTPAIGELPARTALATDPAITGDEKLKPFIDSLEFSYSNFMVNEADLRQAVMDAFDQVTLNGLDPESALQEAQDKIQQQLDDYFSQLEG